jgi:hypothetical protein
VTTSAFPNRIARAALAVSLWLSAAPGAHAQLLPSAPLSFGGGRVVMSGSVSASIAPSDDRAYYNLTGYNNDILRLFEVSFDASVRLASRADIVVGVDGLTPIDHWSWNGYAPSLHLAVRPWAQRPFTIRAGIVEPPFGAFLRRTYGRGNLLIGYPLGYQYASTVRPDAFPASTDDLLWLPGGRVSRRGLGAVTRYSLGDTYRGPGLSLVNPFGWNPGVEVEAGRNTLRGSLALLRGGISNRYHREGASDSGWTVDGRLEARPTPGLVLGTSLAYGGYVDDEWRPTADTAVYNRTPRETALGFDAEYSRAYWLVRGEAILGRRTVPAFSAPYLADPLHAGWLMVEGRYKLFPGMYVAGRVERLSFSTVAGSTTTESWDAPVTRLEVGGGYSITRNVLGKISYQHNARESHWYPRQQLVAAQVVLWF